MRRRRAGIVGIGVVMAVTGGCASPPEGYRGVYDGVQRIQVAAEPVAESAAAFVLIVTGDRALRSRPVEGAVPLSCTLQLELLEPTSNFRVVGDCRQIPGAGTCYVNGRVEGGGTYVGNRFGLQASGMGARFCNGETTMGTPVTLNVEVNATLTAR